MFAKGRMLQAGYLELTPLCLPRFPAQSRIFTVRSRQVNVATPRWMRTSLSGEAVEGASMIFASCVQCGYAMDISQEFPELVEAPLACPRCGGLNLELQTADDPEDEAA